MSHFSFLDGSVVGSEEEGRGGLAEGLVPKDGQVLVVEGLVGRQTSLGFTNNREHPRLTLLRSIG